MKAPQFWAALSAGCGAAFFRVVTCKKRRVPASEVDILQMRSGCRKILPGAEASTSGAPRGGAQFRRPLEGKNPPPSQSSLETMEPRSKDAPLIRIDLARLLLEGCRAADLREEISSVLRWVCGSARHLMSPRRRRLETPASGVDISPHQARNHGKEPQEEGPRPLAAHSPGAAS